MPILVVALSVARIDTGKEAKLNSTAFLPMELRNRWVRAMRRDNWSPKERSRLCSEHFISSNLFVQLCMQLILFHRFYDTIEEPSMFMNDPDYVPSCSVCIFECNQ